ncbi:putative serpin-Z5 [Phragmites australis]|uniref:putative serpin-Z5 n=1 Tax=Phragmites australis TaxID=29695 RepID=UPI002D76DC21|nr:putative serpin-Z5 [Phragmites australis]
MATVRDGQAALALRLARHLLPGGGTADGNNVNGNVAFSPLSVHTALALVAEGARGDTLGQLLDFLGAPWLSDLAAFAARVADDIVADWSASGGPKVLLGGGVWVNASRGALRKAFRDTAAGTYSAEAATVDFQKKPEDAAKMINDLIKRATNNLVESVISAEDIVRAETDIVLANAIYFSGRWPERTFHPWNTKPGPFYRLDGSFVDVPFMFSDCDQYAMAMDGFKVLRLPYKQGRRTEYSMCIFLPDAREGISAMVDAITALPGALRNAIPKKRVLAIVKLPKFKISYECQFDRVLPEMGLRLPFSRDTADLRGMVETDGKDPSRPAFLSGMVSTAVVEVNEEGTEASAFTTCLRGGGLGPQPGPFKFVANHPFTFFIVEEWSGVVVFAGHVLDATM